MRISYAASQEHGVAALVAVRVVHLLEAVEVQDNHGHRAAGEVSLLLDLQHAGGQRRAVEEARERVEYGAVAVLQLTLREGAHDRGDGDQQRQGGDRRVGSSATAWTSTPTETPNIVAAVIAAPTMTTWGRKRAAEWRPGGSSS